jgi:hypothetical protein
MLVAAFAVILFSLRHSIKHYCPRNRGLVNRAVGLFRFTPLRFKILFPLLAALIAYQGLVAWRFEYSPLRVGGNLAAIFVGGYLPSLLILYVQILFGFINPNEDQELIRQRQERHRQMNREMGIVPKPSWWRRVNGEVLNPNASMRERLAANARELHGSKPAAAGAGEDGGPAVPLDAAGPVEMTPVRPPPPAAQRLERLDLVAEDGPPPAYSEVVRAGPPSVARTASGQSTDQPPQRIRSMLDV